MGREGKRELRGRKEREREGGGAERRGKGRERGG